MYARNRCRPRRMDPLRLCVRCEALIEKENDLFVVTTKGGLTPTEWEETSNLCPRCNKEHNLWLQSKLR
jgi:hypothetical protein